MTITITDYATKIILGRNAAFGTLEVDPTRFPPAVQAYLYDYGLRQVLNDAMADKTDEKGEPLPAEHVRAKAQKRLDALYAGTMRVRGEGGAPGPVDAVEAELWALVRAAIHATYTASGAYRAVPKGTKNRMLAAANARRAVRKLPPLANDAEMIQAYMDTVPGAEAKRAEAERNVRERAEAAANGAGDL